MKISKWVLLWAAACFVIGCNDDSGTKDDAGGQSQTCKAEGQVKCGDGCIDPKTDEAYCGADEKCEKFTACGENQTCESGKCKDNEMPKACEVEGQVKCGDGCIDPKTDKGYCGADENCEKYIACGENQTCESGKCKDNEPSKACEVEGQVKCGDACIDPKTDKEYCGADENCENYTACGDQTVCDGGECRYDYDSVTADTPSFATNDGIANGITFRMINKTGKDICFSGKFKPYIKKDGPMNGWNSDGSASPTTQELECHQTPPSSVADGWPHWHVNDIKLAVGESREFSLTEFKEYAGNGTTVQTVVIPMDTYTNGEWYFVAEDNVAAGGPAIKVGFAAMESEGKRSNSAYIIHVRPVKASDAKIEKGKKYNLVIYNADTDSKYWYCD